RIHEQFIATGLGLGDQPRHEFLLAEPRRDRWQEARPYRSRIAQELAAGAVERGPMGYRNHRQEELGVEVGGAVFVGRHVPRRAARALGIDDELAGVSRKLGFRCRHDGSQRLGPVSAIDRDHPHLEDVPAEERYPGQLALENVEGVVEKWKEGDRVPEGLVLRRQYEGPFRQVLEPRNIAARAGNNAIEPQAGSRPELWHEPGTVARRKEIEWRPEEHLNDHACIKGQVESQRAKIK